MNRKFFKTQKVNIKTLLLAICTIFCASFLAACDMFKKEVPVETLTITSATQVKVGSSGLKMTALITPSNATDKDVEYEIVSDGTNASGATITDNILTATGIGKINVRAKSGEIEAYKTFYAVNTPVGSIIITNQKNTQTVKEEFNSTNLSETGWKLGGLGSASYITNNNSQWAYSGECYLQTTNSDSYFYKEVYLDKEDKIDISFYTGSYNLLYSSDPVIKLSNDDGETWITVTERFNNTDKPKKFNAVISGFKIDGTNRKILLGIFKTNDGNALTNPWLIVDDITYTITHNSISAKLGEPLALTSYVNSSGSANIIERTYRILESSAEGAVIEGSSLTSTSTGIVKVIAVANGIESKPVSININ